MDKWICEKCNSINPSLSFVCHGCGKDTSQDYTYATSNSTGIHNKLVERWEQHRLGFINKRRSRLKLVKDGNND